MSAVPILRADPGPHPARRADQTSSDHPAGGGPVRLTCVAPATNRFRFYELRWEQDLFHQLVLVRIFGRIGRPGRIFSQAYPDEASLQKEAERLIRRRLQHGYQLSL
jgi:predicted DNA-binding WGR domain protein